MKRVVVAAVIVAAVGLIGFTAPARSATMYAATMTNTPGGFKFAHGVCGNSTGNGDFQVEVGDSITWTNCTQADHTVTGTGNSFGSTDHVVPGDSVTYTFASPGTIPYHCEIHPSMTGTIKVTGVEVTTTVATTTTTATTIKPTTTSTSVKASTTTTDNLNGVFGEPSTTSTTETTLFTTDTTRALGSGGDDSTSPGLIALLIVGLGAVGTAGALLIRRMRAESPPT